MIEVKFESGNNRAACYDADENSKTVLVGECTFIDGDGTWNLNHTFVDKSYGGQGLAKKLLDCVVAEARLRHVKIIPTCSYVVREFSAHPELCKDLV